jgi:AcrR family transcriptional regulator
VTRSRRKRGYEKLLETAQRLFYQRGFHAVGISEIIAEAGVARMTLYNNAASKEALIEAIIERASNQVMAWLERGASSSTGPTLPPGQRLPAIFDLYEAWFNEPEFSGCLFARAAAEFPAHDHPVHRAAANHKRRLFEFLEEIAGDAGARQPAMLAEQLLLLLEGATALAQQTGALIAARRARRAAEQLIAAGS